MFIRTSRVFVLFWGIRRMSSLPRWIIPYYLCLDQIMCRMQIRRRRIHKNIGETTGEIRYSSSKNKVCTLWRDEFNSIRWLSYYAWLTCLPLKHLRAFKSTALRKLRFNDMGSNNIIVRGLTKQYKQQQLPQDNLLIRFMHGGPAKIFIGINDDLHTVNAFDEKSRDHRKHFKSNIYCHIGLFLWSGRNLDCSWVAC